jgi:hypothetical protein
MCATLLMSFLLLQPAGDSAAPDSKEEAKKPQQESDELKALKEELESAKTELERYQRGRINRSVRKVRIPKNKKSRVSFQNIQVKRLYTRRAQKTVSDISRKISILGRPKRLKLPLKLGDTGLLEVGQILQVVDDDEMLLKIDYVVSKGGLFIGNNMVTSRETSSYYVWVKGVSTKGRVDRTRAEFDQKFKVTGTKTYRTAKGSNTVFVVEPVKNELKGNGEKKKSR